MFQGRRQADAKVYAETQRRGRPNASPGGARSRGAAGPHAQGRSGEGRLHTCEYAPLTSHQGAKTVFSTDGSGMVGRPHRDGATDLTPFTRINESRSQTSESNRKLPNPCGVTLGMTAGERTPWCRPQPAAAVRKIPSPLHKALGNDSVLPPGRRGVWLTPVAPRKTSVRAWPPIRAEPLPAWSLTRPASRGAPAHSVLGTDPLCSPLGWGQTPALPLSTQAR